jgi:glycosyltransferase involved in cell wall biosynthesis
VNHFAIVTVVKNDLIGLKKTRASLEGQKFALWTHIIVDGASTDGTPQYLQSLPGDNTVFISEPDSGIYDAMNKGWRLAKDQSFVLFLNARDEMASPDSLYQANIALVEKSSSDWGCTTHEEIDQDGTGWVCKLVSPPSIANQLYAFGYRSHQGVIMRKSFIEHLGGFDERYHLAADWDLIVRAMRTTKPIIWIYPLARFELGGISSSLILEAHQELIQLRKKYLKWTPGMYFWEFVWRRMVLSPLRLNEEPFKIKNRSFFTYQILVMARIQRVCNILSVIYFRLRELSVFSIIRVFNLLKKSVRKILCSVRQKIFKAMLRGLGLNSYDIGK